MNNASAQPLSGIPPRAQPAPKAAQDICARIDALLAALLRWAGRLGLLGRLIAPRVHAFVSALRALSTLFAHLAADDLPPALPAARRKRTPEPPTRTPSGTRPAPHRARATQIVRRAAPYPLPRPATAHLAVARAPSHRRPAHAWRRKPVEIQKSASRATRLRSPLLLLLRNTNRKPSRHPRPCLHYPT